MARKGYPAEFRRRALDVVAAGKTVAEVARLLEVSDQSIYTWRRQELNVSSAGFYGWRFRPPSARAVRHAWLTDVIREVHLASYGNYGAKRVHAELVLGRGIQVGHNVVALLSNPGEVSIPRRFAPGQKTDQPSRPCRQTDGTVSWRLRGCCARSRRLRRRGSVA